MRRGPLVAAGIIAVVVILLEGLLFLAYNTQPVIPSPASAPVPIASLRDTVQRDPRFLASENGSNFIFDSYNYYNFPNGTAKSISLIFYKYGNQTGHGGCGIGPLTWEINDQLYANIPIVSGSFNETAMSLEHFGPPIYIYNCPAFVLSPFLGIPILFGIITIVVELGFYLGRPRKEAAE